MTVRGTIPSVASSREDNRVATEKLVTAILILLGINCSVLFFFVEGYDVNFGPLHFHAYSLSKWLALTWIVVFSKAWLVARRTGRPFVELLRAPALLCLAVGTVYVANETPVLTGDTESTRYIPYSVVRELDFDLDEFADLQSPEVRVHAPHGIKDEIPDEVRLQRKKSITRFDGHLVGTFPPWTGVLAVPVYLPTMLKADPPLYHVVLALEKRAAAFIAVLAVAMFYLLMRRVTTERVAWGLSLVYALGTSTFSISSQALWQHGPAQLFLTVTMYCLLRAPEHDRFLIYAGLATGCTVLVRPLELVITLPILAFVVHQYGKRLSQFLLGGAVPFLLFVSYNYAYFGRPLTTGFSQQVLSPTTLPLSWFPTPILEGLGLVLFSPWKGLFVYSPVLLLSLLGIMMIWREPNQILYKYMSLVPLCLLIPVAKLVPDMGTEYGPRLLTEITPVLCLFLYPVYERWGGATMMRWAFWGLAGVSMFMHALGGWSDGAWFYSAQAFDDNPGRYWSWASSPPFYYSSQLVNLAFGRP